MSEGDRNLAQRVWQALGTVLDPELGINIVDLGLVYRVELAEDAVRVTMTATSRACPLGPHLLESARAAILQQVPEVRNVAVELVWEPEWTPDRASPGARMLLGW
jgi:metal-sulfur cluster biosynthetic enzyme